MRIVEFWARPTVPGAGEKFQYKHYFACPLHIQKDAF